MLQSSNKSAWRRGTMLVITAVLAMTLMAACGAKETVIATYKGGNVTDAEFDKYIAVFNVLQPGYEQVIAVPQFKEQLLQQYISYKIVGSQASEESKKKAADDVKEQMKQYKDALSKDANLKAAVDKQKVKNKDMENYMLMTSVLVAHMNSKVTDDEMKKELETNPANYATISARHILVLTKTTDPTTKEEKDVRTPEEALKIAKEVKAKLEAGGDWTALAKEYSEDPESKDVGGLYSDKKGREWVENFKLAAFKQEIGVIGEPVETEYGYHVIKVEKRDNKTFDTMAEADKEELRAAVAYVHMNKFMTDEMPKQEVVITLPKDETTDEKAPATDETPASDKPDGEKAPATDAPETK